jgi:hypothetical protein
MGYLPDAPPPPTPTEQRKTSTPIARMGSASRIASICAVDISASSVPTSRSPVEELEEELTRYFNFGGGNGDLFNPLAWWKVRTLHRSLLARSDSGIGQKNGPAFPILSKMARDYLAIPATSVSVERLFSKYRNICRDLRSSLHAETIREALLTKVWIRSDLFNVLPPKPLIAKHGSAVHLK